MTEEPTETEQRVVGTARAGVRVPPDAILAYGVGSTVHWQRTTHTDEEATGDTAQQ